MIPPNESTIFFNGIVIAAGLANIWYWFAISKLNKKIKQVEDNKPYILHLEGLIKDYENKTKRLLILLKDGKSTGECE